MMRKFKRFLRKVLPSPIVKSIKFVKYSFIGLVSRVSARVKVALNLPLHRKKKKIQFEINLAEHCNLNCKGCSNFSCLAEPEFVSIEEFSREMKRMGDIFGHKCERIHLIGGEPLLNPDITALSKIARENFTEGIIDIYTNGILLPKMDDDFWRTCGDCGIKIVISAYPIKLDTEKIRTSAQKYGVDVQWAFGQEEGERNTFTVQPINLAGTSNVKLNFAMCGRANGCITLSKGRLFTCTFAPHVRHFNKYFKQNVNITEADSVNIYDDDITADEILRRMAEPIPACRYCKLEGRPRPIKWGISQRDINEWL